METRKCTRRHRPLRSFRLCGGEPRRTEVESLAARAKAAGLLHWPAEDNGPVVGYRCGLKDPDGHVAEFSIGQQKGK